MFVDYLNLYPKTSPSRINATTPLIDLQYYKVGLTTLSFGNVANQPFSTPKPSQAKPAHNLEPQGTNTFAFVSLCQIKIASQHSLICPSDTSHRKAAITAVLRTQPSYRASRVYTRPLPKPNRKMSLFHTKRFGRRHVNAGVTVSNNGIHRRRNLGRLNPFRRGLFRRRRVIAA